MNTGPVLNPDDTPAPTMDDATADALEAEYVATTSPVEEAIAQIRRDQQRIRSTRLVSDDGMVVWIADKGIVRSLLTEQKDRDGNSLGLAYQDVPLASATYMAGRLEARVVARGEGELAGFTCYNLANVIVPGIRASVENAGTIILWRKWTQAQLDKAREQAEKRDRAFEMPQLTAENEEVIAQQPWDIDGKGMTFQLLINFHPPQVIQIQD